MTDIVPGTPGMPALRLIDLARNDPLAALTRRIGAVIEARVVTSVRVAQSNMYAIVLQIGARQVRADSATPQRAGSIVRLQVMPGARLQPVPGSSTAALAAPMATRAPPPQTATTLAGAPRALTHPAPAGPPGLRQAILERGLRLALPLQRPLAAVLEALRRRASEVETTRLPAPLRAALAGLATAPPSASALADPAVLQQMIRDSGLFLEANLAAGAPPGLPLADLKLRLWLVAARLQGAIAASPAGTRPPPASLARGDTAHELLGLVRSALARLQVQQIGALLSQQGQPAGDGAAAATLALELPVLHEGRIETVLLTVERFATPREPRGRRRDEWQVSLAIDLGAVGVLHAQVLCRASELSATFWGEPPTLQLVQRHVGALSDALAGHGVHLRQIAYRDGAPPARAAHGLRRLVDVTT